MSIVTIAQIALGFVLIVAAAWRWPKQRVNFVSENRYVSFITGLCLAFVGGALAEANTRFGYPRQFVYAGGAVAFVEVGLILWGWRGYKPKSN